MHAEEEEMNKIATLTPFLSVAPQLSEAELGTLAAQGFKAVINNRPDGEAADQPSSAVLEAAAKRHGLAYRYLPVVSGKLSDDDVTAFADALSALRGPVLAFCRTGTRSATLWALSEAARLDTDVILRTAQGAGYDLSAMRPRLEARWDRADVFVRARAADHPHVPSFDVLVVGGGTAGISVSSSLLNRRPELSIAVIEPSDKHYYQPGWTLVGGGDYSRAATERPMERCMPKAVRWIRAAAAAFEPDHNEVVLEDGERVTYRTLIVCPGIKLDWQGIDGLSETLGRNGVTCNYAFDMAAYTWELVRNMHSGRALFTQPPMPIKCAGAPQKAMYLSCDHWRRRGVLKDIDVEFDNAGGVLFGVPDFVPPLMNYVKKYNAKLAFNSTLKAIDGPGKRAWFEVIAADGTKTTQEKRFDMIHVVPPQRAPDFVRASPLADAAGWVEVSPETLQHVRYGNIFGLGDACSTPNAKTAAAIRKQAPVVAENVIGVLDGRGPRAVYDGYGACPLIVERGKVILAEFAYGGRLTPSFPLKPTVARRSAWILKARLFPFIYWDMVLKGREWLARPQILPHEPQAHEAQEACNFAEATAATAKRA
jgi:sulfide:quinone oxidoreductase